ncbi:hypothetical protein ACIPVB_08915 [Microbacterium sp. NPDC090007]|uniref:hypothetical protein n=1 Tax=Microbacterium sp. NPDC090007 TaxID=3364204 RepID=UPI00380D25CB
MAVSITDSVGYEGTVDEPQWARLMAYAGGRQYGVIGEGDWKVTAGTADREIRIAPGSGFGSGVLDRTTVAASLVLPAPASGSRWHLIAARRDWQNNLTTLDSIPGSTGAAALPVRAVTPGTADDHPIALVQATAGQSQVTQIIDLRVWGSDGGSYALDELVLQFLNRLGTQVQIGGRSWMRTLNNLGTPMWTELGVGRLLSVVSLVWDSTMGQSFAPGANGAVNWPETARNIARLDFPDPGVPYRVRMYAQGFWGSEGDDGTRFDFDMVVGSTTIATKLPAGDEFFFGNWRSWAPPASAQTFVGAQSLFFRARRIAGPGTFGAVRKSESFVTAEIYSA